MSEVEAKQAAVEILKRDLTKADALAADRLEMNKELEAAALKVLRTSLDRLELLRRWNKHRVEVSHEDCPFCGAEVQVDTTPPPETMILFIDNHANGCELAEELGDD